jgi:hypothetical protein
LTDVNTRVVRPRRKRAGRFLHGEVNRLVAAQVAPDSRVIDVGAGDGSLLLTLNTSAAVGIEPDAEGIPEEISIVSGPVEAIHKAPLIDSDYIILSLVLDEVYDVQAVLDRVGKWSTPQTRSIVVTYSRLWRPLLAVAEWLGLKRKTIPENYVSRATVLNLLELEGFETTKRLSGVIMPLYIPLVSRFLNRWIAPLPILRHLALIEVVVARKLQGSAFDAQSVSVIVPARNEAGNIPQIVARIPQLAPLVEVIFIEGGSSDETWPAITKVVDEYRGHESFSVTGLQQSGVGKGDAVRLGFETAQGDVALILDADLSVPPEELPRFVQALERGTCEFANGSRLVYPMDDRAMRFLNLLGNRFFAGLFSYLLSQPIGDTLCGTKALRRTALRRIMANRDYFGELDPFGDFDLILGSAYLGLRIRDIPVHYKERVYGMTNISRFSSGWLLLRMAGRAAKKIKFVG